MEKEPQNLSKEETADILDSLKMEAQTVSPAEAEKNKKIVKECNQALEHYFGRFLNKDIADDQMADSFIFTDKEIYERFFDNFTECSISYEGISKENSYFRRYNQDGTEFVIGHSPDVWSLLDNESRERLIKEYGNEKEARENADIRFKKFLYAHEIAHMHGNYELPVWFQECGANYYATYIMKKMNYKNFKVEPLDQRAAYYQSLLEQFGENIHSLFFGQISMSSDLFNQVFKNFERETEEKLFPEKFKQKL